MDSVKWYYLDAGQQQGPASTKSLRGLLSSGELPPGTMVWASNMADWQPANTIGILKQSKTSRPTHWLVTPLIILLSVLVLVSGGKHLTNKKDQTAQPANEIMGKRIANPYEDELSFLLPRNNVQKAQRKNEQLPKNKYPIHKPKAPATTPASTFHRLSTTEKKEHYNGIIENLKTENEMLAKQVMELKTTQSDPLARTKLLQLSRQLNQLKENYLESVRENQSLQNKLQLQKQQTEPALNNQKKIELEEMKSELAKKTHHVDMLEDQLAVLRDTLSKLQKISLNTHKSTPQLVGRIANLQINKRTLVFNLTPAKQISNGETLHIKNKTNGKNLGKATVLQVFRSKCVAKFGGENISHLSLGDYLFRPVGQ